MSARDACPSTRYLIVHVAGVFGTTALGLNHGVSSVISTAGIANDFFSLKVCVLPISSGASDFQGVAL